MTDSEYMSRMIVLTETLSYLANVQPLEQKAWDATIDELHEVTCEWHHSRHRRPRFFTYLCWFLLGVLAWVILRISC